MTTENMEKLNKEINFEAFAAKPRTEEISRTEEIRLAAVNTIGVATIAPVIFTGTAGGGGEYHASNNPNVPERHVINISIPSGARIIGAWYTPLHNIPALGAFALIEVVPNGAAQVLLSIAGYAGSNNRLRITIHVLYSA